jgi:hypothetical protein
LDFTRFAGLFAGNLRFYGTYNQINAERKDGKLTGKALTLFRPVTEALYAQHLAGSAGLGIAPIRDDTTCVFGAIDIDVYAGLDHASIAQRLQKLGLKLVVCRSKSGGAHLYLFLKAPAPAAKVRSYLQEVAAAIGRPIGTEVFPKQTYFATEDPQAAASWINLPYFNAEDPNCARYAVRADGYAFTLDEFMAHAEESRVDVNVLSRPVSASPDFADGPPCLQAIATSGGCPAGARNNGLFAIGVYLRKSNPDRHGTMLDEYNQLYVSPPLPSEEIVQIKKSLSRKTYTYRCQEEPLVSHCNAGVCRLRKYGIGGGTGALPQFGALKKLETDPPSYTWEIDGKMVSLTADELLSYTAFSRAVFMRLNKLMPPLRPAQWKEALSAALEQMESIPMPEDASPDGQLWEHVKRFCNTSAMAISLEDVPELGKVFKSEGIYHLRIADIVQYLGSKHFKAPPVQEIAASLRRHGAKHWVKKLRGQAVNLWLLPTAGIATVEESLAMPESLTNGDQHQF